VTLLLVQCHQVLGLAESCGCLKPCSRESGVFCVEVSPLDAGTSELPTTINSPENVKAAMRRTSLRLLSIRLGIRFCESSSKGWFGLLVTSQQAKEPFAKLSFSPSFSLGFTVGLNFEEPS